MAKILILDDEYEQRHYLKSILAAEDSDYLIFEAATYEEARELSFLNDIDLFILDIELDNKTGVDFAQEIRQLPQYKYVWILFITAHGEYINNALNSTQCIGYITKPFKKEHVIDLVVKYIDYKILPNSIEKHYLCLNKKGVCIKIAVDDILYVEIFNKKCTFFIKSNLKNPLEISKMTLSKLISFLPDNTFLRCHRSYLVNKKYIVKLDKSTVPWQIAIAQSNKNMINPIPVGITYKYNVLKYFEDEQ